MGISMDDIKTLRAKTSAGIALCKEALVESDGDMQKAVEYINKRSDVVSRLHNLTGAKIGLCKIAFADAGEDFEKAVEIITERGWSDEMAKGSECAVKDGIIEAYVHGTDHKTVALAEVTCVTDFVARNEKFVNFAHEVAMQVAAMGPKYVSRESISEQELNDVKSLFLREIESEGKPAEIAEKIVEGKLNKYFEENCLLNQKWIKDESKTMQNLLDEVIGALGEPITIRRILLWKLGE